MSETLTLAYNDGSLEYIREKFWQLWQQERESLYRCCLKWMGNNRTEAEDALSQAMLKAWEKLQAGACRIVNFQAWVRSLTRNLCTDILRSLGRDAKRIENIETAELLVGEVMVNQEEESDSAVKRRERGKILLRAIDELPPRLGEPVRLHYYQDKSYLEIAEELGISYDNVRKRMSQARGILREKLSEFLGEEDDVPPAPRKRGKSKKGTLAEPAVGESLASPSGELEEVLPVESGEPVDADLSVVRGEPASEEASVEGELRIVAGGFEREAGVSVAPASFEALDEERLGIVAGGLPQEAGLCVVPVAPASGEAKEKGNFGIVAGGKPVLGELDTGRMMKNFCTILATPLPHLFAGWGTGGTPVLRLDMGTGVSPAPGQKSVRDEDEGSVLESQTFSNQLYFCVTQVYRRGVLPAVGKLDLLRAYVREMRSLFGLRWRVWADSGGCWLSSMWKIHREKKE